MIDNYHFSKSPLQCCTNHLVSVLEINYMITLFMTFVYWEVGKRWQGTYEIKVSSHLDIIHICINDCLRRPPPPHGKKHLKFPFWLFDYLPYLHCFVTKFCHILHAFMWRTRQSKQCGFSIYIFDNSKSKSMVRLVSAEKMVLSGLVFARKTARMILIHNI